MGYGPYSGLGSAPWPRRSTISCRSSRRRPGERGRRPSPARRPSRRSTRSPPSSSSSASSAASPSASSRRAPASSRARSAASRVGARTRPRRRLRLWRAPSAASCESFPRGSGRGRPFVSRGRGALAREPRRGASCLARHAGPAREDGGARARCHVASAVLAPCERGRKAERDVRAAREIATPSRRPLIALEPTAQPAREQHVCELDGRRHEDEEQPEREDLDRHRSLPRVHELRQEREEEERRLRVQEIDEESLTEDVLQLSFGLQVLRLRILAREYLAESEEQ